MALHVTGLPPTHAPVWQLSVCVHLLPSLQTEPSGLLGFEHTPVFVSQMPTSWHGPLTVHVTALLPVHLPAKQPSVLVQALPSSQAVPSLRGTAAHAPVFASHVPTLQASSRLEQLTAVPATQLKVCRLHFSTPLQALPSLQSASLAQPHLLWSKKQPPGSTQLSTVHAILSSQLTPAPPHTPLLHTSPPVHALPSLHGVLSGLLGLLQSPVAGSQVPASWHWSLAVHVTGLAPLHTPAWQLSVLVQALLSLHAEPSLLAGLLHLPVPASQLPAVWHWSLAAHVTGLAPLHTPLWQLSVCVHRVPSLQAEPSALAGLLHLPVPASQLPALWH